MSSLLQDVRIALRDLRAAPMTTAAAMLVIALGSGVNLAVLAVVHGVLLKPLPYPDAARLMVLSMAAPDGVNFSVQGTEIEALAPASAHGRVPRWLCHGRTRRAWSWRATFGADSVCHRVVLQGSRRPTDTRSPGSV